MGLKPGFVSGGSLDWFEFTLFDHLPEYLRGVDNEDEKLAAILASFEDKDDNRKWDRILNYGNENREKNPLIDYIAWTVEEVPALLGLSGVLERQERGMLGYRTRHVISGVQILSDGGPGMGVHVICSGSVVKACSLDVPALCKTIYYDGGKASRIDLAVDDFDGALDLDLMVKKCKAGEASSRMKEWQVIESGTFKDGTITGRTLYAGARSSDLMLRAYDKRLERLAAGAVASLLPDKWVRVEAEVKGAAARNMQALLASGANPSRVGVELINNYLSFKDRGKDSNKSRWPVSEWWSEWLSGAGKRSVSRSVMPATIDSRCRWFGRQVNKSMAIIAMSVGVDWLEESFHAGRRKMSEEEILEAKKYSEARKEKERKTAEILEQAAILREKDAEKFRQQLDENQAYLDPEFG